MKKNIDQLRRLSHVTSYQNCTSSVHYVIVWNCYAIEDDAPEAAEAAVDEGSALQYSGYPSHNSDQQ